MARGGAGFSVPRRDRCDFEFLEALKLLKHRGMPRRAPLALALLLGLAALALARPGWGAAAAGGFDSARFAPFYFIHASDPHLSDTLSMRRFTSLAPEAARLQPPFVLVGGDLGVSARPGDWSLYNAAATSFTMPLKPIPGNHDVFNAATLAGYRARVGADYYSFVYNNCAFICLDTVTLLNAATYPVEYQQQWAWLEQTLKAAAAARRTRIYILAHHPPYTYHESDKNDYWAFPLAERQRLLTLARDSSHYVDAILAGHRHMNMSHPGDRPAVHILAGSAYNTDVYGEGPPGIGYSVIRVTPDGTDSIFVRQDGPADTAPPAPPYPLTVTARTTSSVTLSWPRPADNVGVLRYAIARDGAPCGETLLERFTDAGLAPGESHRYSVTAIDVAGNVSAPSNTLQAAPGAEGVRDYLVAGGPWRYHSSGASPGAGWASLLYDDSLWPVGFAQLGYGEGDEATTISFGANPASKFLTAYFRARYNLADPGVARRPTLKVLCGDGAVVYFNGAEIGRVNMPGGTVGVATRASSDLSGAAGNAWHEFPFPWNLLRPGANVVAVEVHLARPDAAALSFDLQLADTMVDAPARVSRGPYLQAPSPSAITVRWRTDAPAMSRVTCGLSPDARTIQLTDLAAKTEHELRLGGLRPGVKYYYAIEGALGELTGGDAATCFTMPPVSGADAPARIWVLGDSGTGSEGPGPAANAQAVRDAFLKRPGERPPDLTLMLGDNARPSGTDDQFQQAVFEMFKPLLRTTPLWSTLGNHDAYNPAPHPYYQLHTFPTQGECGGVASGSEAWYSFNYGPIHFICLDSMESDRSPGGPMLTWLKTDLAAATARWTVAFFHHPPYSRGAHNSDLAGDDGFKQIEMRQNALPILEAGGVDLVLSGHSHSYERSCLLNGHYGLSGTLSTTMTLDRGDGDVFGTGPYVKPLARTANAGTVYAVVGNSGLLAGGAFDHPVMKRSLQTLGSLVIDVRGPRLDARMIDEKGILRDRFTIWKGLSGAGGWRNYP